MTPGPLCEKTGRWSVSSFPKAGYFTGSLRLSTTTFSRKDGFPREWQGNQKQKRCLSKKCNETTHGHEMLRKSDSLPAYATDLLIAYLLWTGFSSRGTAPICYAKAARIWLIRTLADSGLQWESMDLRLPNHAVLPSPIRPLNVQEIGVIEWPETQ